MKRNNTALSLQFSTYITSKGYGVILLIFLLIACRGQDTSSTSINTPTVYTTITSATNYPTAEQLKLEWLQPSDCAQPCWEGIRIGEITRNQTIKWLRDKGYNVSTKTGSINARFEYESDHGITENGVLLQSRTFAGDAPITAITVGLPLTRLNEAITLLGEPSHVLVYRDQPSDSNKIYWELHVVWLEQGLDLYQSGVHEPPDITEDLRLVSMLYFFPTREGYNEVSPNGDFLRDWEGYRDFSFYDVTEEVMNAPDLLEE